MDVHEVINVWNKDGGRWRALLQRGATRPFWIETCRSNSFEHYTIERQEDTNGYFEIHGSRNDLWIWQP